jgi:putative membrane protein
LLLVLLSLPAAGATSEQAARSVLAAADLEFVVQLLTISVEQVELGKLALKKTASGEVKQFAQRMLVDHPKVQEELQEIFRAKGLPVPPAPREQRLGTLAKLNSLSGEGFDRSYMDESLAAVSRLIAMSEREQQSGVDLEVRQFSSTTLTMLQGHMKMALSAQATTRPRVP